LRRGCVFTALLFFKEPYLAQATFFMPLVVQYPKPFAAIFSLNFLP